MAGQYIDISQNLNSYCLGEKTTPDLLKFYKEINISFDEKINSIILFLKTCIGINQDFYKSHPTMIERKDGVIIIISSVGGLKGSELLGAYSISKAADMQLARNIAVEHGPHQ